jgi:hypothetical protein
MRRRRPKALRRLSHDLACCAVAYRYLGLCRCGTEGNDDDKMLQLSKNCPRLEWLDAAFSLSVASVIRAIECMPRLEIIEYIPQKWVRSHHSTERLERCLLHMHSCSLVDTLRVAKNTRVALVACKLSWRQRRRCPRQRRPLCTVCRKARNPRPADARCKRGREG